MSVLFADTSFFVAYLNARDVHHELALEYMAELLSDDFSGAICSRHGTC